MRKHLIDGVEVDYTPAEEAARDAEEVLAAENVIRQQKEGAIKAEGLTRITVHLPGIDEIDELETLRKFAPAFQLSAAGVSAKDIYLYAKTKIQQARTAPIAAVQAYDPITDPNWP